jgi:putative hemolysin
MKTPYFKAKWSLKIEADDFIVKTAESQEDIEKAQKLRHKIFLEEGLGQSHATGLDFDAFDSIADHLMIIDKKSGDAVGTYRLIHSSEAPKFYSQSEFYLDEFLQIDGAKLEMGRACTHMDFRNGRTMDLLWQGLSLYISLSKTRYLFGCSSVKTTDGLFMFSMIKSLSENQQLKWDFNVYPLAEFQWPNAQAIFNTAAPLKGYTKELPPLLRSYLNAGSFVYGLPAYDKDFLCFDLFTILDLQKLNKKFQARYNLENFLKTIY